MVTLFGLAAACGDGPVVPDEGIPQEFPDASSAVDGGGGMSDIPEGEVFETLGRLSVADQDEGLVSVWDLDVRALVTSYTLSAPSTLHAASNRQITAAVAAQPSAGRFDVFAVGVWVWDHVDHFHVYKDPAVIQVDPDLAYADGLSDVQVNSGWIVAFDDASGRTTALFERSIGPLRTDVPRSRLPIFRTVEGAPHDGVATVARGHLFVTRADGGVDRWSQGAEGFEDPISLACDGPGAGTAAGFTALFDCAGDMLLSRWNEATEAFDDLRVARPEGASRPVHLMGEDDLPTFAGPTDEGLLLVDRSNATARLVPLDGEVTVLTSDRDGMMLLVLLDSGELLDLDPVTGEERRSLDLGAGSPLADLAVGEGFAYVAEPDAGRVHVVDLAAFAPTEPLEVGGRPGSLVVTALWPGGEPVMH